MYYRGDEEKLALEEAVQARECFEWSTYEEGREHVSNLCTSYLKYNLHNA